MSGTSFLIKRDKLTSGQNVIATKAIELTPDRAVHTSQNDRVIEVPTTRTTLPRAVNAVDGEKLHESLLVEESVNFSPPHKLGGEKER